MSQYPRETFTTRHNKYRETRSVMTENNLQWNDPPPTEEEQTDLGLDDDESNLLLARVRKKRRAIRSTKRRMMKAIHPESYHLTLYQRQLPGLYIAIQRISTSFQIFRSCSKQAINNFWSGQTSGN